MVEVSAQTRMFGPADGEPPARRYGPVERVAGEHAGGDGWRVIRLHRWPEGSSADTAARDAVLISMTRQTGHPVLAGTVFDSDGVRTAVQLVRSFADILTTCTATS